MKSNILHERQARYEQFKKNLIVDGKYIWAGSLLQRASQKWPHREALICSGKKITFKNLYARAVAFSKKLLAQGIKEGDIVALLYENSIEFYVAYYSIWQLGALVTPLNTLLKPHEITQILEHAEPKLVVISPALKEKVVYPQCPLLIDQLDTIAEDFDPHFAPVARAPELPAVILYTSGTTGFPKGVVLSSSNILINCAQGASEFIDEEEHEVIYAALPLFHSYPQNTAVWSSMMVGATVIIIPKIERKALLEGLEHNPTLIIGIPQLFGLFCLMRNAPFRNVKYFVCGGDALPDKIALYFELIYQRKLCNGYGLTETSPFLSVELADERVPTTLVGAPMPDIIVEVRDEQNKPVPQGTVGQLWVAGPNIMQGYYKAPEATAENIVNGYFATGDLVFLDDRGRIVLAGRSKDLIKSKGIKVYPQEIENILMTHPHITAAAVVGKMVGDEEVPVAYVAVREFSPEIEKSIVPELRDLCVRNLASYKVPQIFIVRASLPATATGKTDKKVLRAEDVPPTT